jgi:hypothetical protein
MCVGVAMVSSNDIISKILLMCKGRFSFINANFWWSILGMNTSDISYIIF